MRILCIILRWMKKIGQDSFSCKERLIRRSGMPNSNKNYKWKKGRNRCKYIRQTQIGSWKNEISGWQRAKGEKRLHEARMGHLARFWWDSMRRWLLLSSRIIATAAWLALVAFRRRNQSARGWDNGKKGKIGPNIRWWTRIRAVHGSPFGNERLPVESDTRHTGAETGLKYARGCKRK